MKVPLMEMAEAYSDWKINCNLTQKKEVDRFIEYLVLGYRTKQYAAICSDTTKNPLLS